MRDKSKLTAWGLTLGAALGIAVGVATGQIGVWLAIGVAIGLALGSAFRQKEPVCPQCAAMHRAHELSRR